MTGVPAGMAPETVARIYRDTSWALEDPDVIAKLAAQGFDLVVAIGFLMKTALERVAAADGNLVVLALDLQEDGERVRGFIESLSLAHLTPVLDTNGSVARRYAVFSLPTTFFLDGQAVVRDVHVGGPMTAEIIGAGIKNEQVIDSIRKTPRHEFVNPRDRQYAYYDMALAIGEGQTISPPFMPLPT